MHPHQNTCTFPAMFSASGIAKRLNPWLTLSLTLALASTSSAALAATQTLQMDELEFSSVTELSVHGVRFGFQENGVASTDAYFNASGPGSLTYVDENVLEGTSAGILSVHFPEPLISLSFGLALSTVEPQMHGATITILGTSGETLSSSTLDFIPLVSYSEVWFHQDVLRASGLRIAFADPQLRFALDKLTYTTLDTAPVPEPSALGLLLGAGAGLICAQKSRRSCRT
jgi:hypothetical protein